MLIVVLLAISLIFIFPVLNMIILGAILAYGIRPIAFRIQSKLKFSSISILLAMIIVLIPLILLVAYISFIISGFLAGFFSSNPNLDMDSVISQLSTYIPQNPFLDKNSIVPAIQSAGKSVLTYLVGKLGSFANITLDLFILICSVYYFVKDGDNCYNFIKSFVPKDFFGCNNWNFTVNTNFWAMADLLGIGYYGCHWRKLSEGYSGFAVWIFLKLNRYVYKTCNFIPSCRYPSIDSVNWIFIRTSCLWYCRFYRRTLNTGHYLCNFR